MSEELSVTICTAVASAACVVCLFFVTRCSIALDATSEARRMEALKQEERLSAERIKQGLEYVPQGIWIKRQPVEQP